MRATRETRAAAPAQQLLTHYDGVICDLDGVVYRGARAVPGAIESLNRATDGDIPVVFATNNASRPRTPWVITSASSASGRVVGP